MMDEYAAMLPASALKMRGKITLPPLVEGGQKRTYIIQGATEDNANARDLDGHPIVIYQYQPPQIGPTIRQRRQRDLMAAAVEWYRGLGAGEKEQFRPAAAAAGITIWNAALKWWMLTNPVSPPSVWDAGSSTWDGTLSEWDHEAGMQWDGASTEWDGGSSTWQR